MLFPKQADDALHMTKVDPDADFSDDYEDLAFNESVLVSNVAHDPVHDFRHGDSIVTCKRFLVSTNCMAGGDDRRASVRGHEQPILPMSRR